MYIYFNPLDKACKSVTGALMQAEEVQLNIFLLKEKRTDFRILTPTPEECLAPEYNACLLLNRDG